MGKIDLHIHTTASDGRFTPEEIVKKAADLGMTTIAIADHDSVAGIDRALLAAGAFPSLRVIPNVEISTDTIDGEVHVLGYFIDYKDAGLAKELEKFRSSRVGRAEKMVGKLKGLGINIEWSRVQQIAGTGSVGRPHVALAMLEKGYISTFHEAFEKYIGNGGPAYVEREKLTPEEAVALVLRARGLPCLAHPFTVSATEVMVATLKKAGLAGLEVYYSNYIAEQQTDLLRMARKYDLIASGGSDFHGVDPAETMIGGIEIPQESLDQILALATKRGLTVG